MGKIRIGLIGCGWIARIHSKCLRDIEDAKITKVYDIDQAAAVSLAQEIGCHVAKNLDEIFSSLDIDAVYICTPHNSHLELIERAILSKKAVFCEKPMGRTIEEAKKAYRLIKQSGTLFMVGFNHRFAPANVKFKKSISRINSPSVISLNFSCAPYLDGWMGRPDEGGGILEGLGCHALDLICYLTKHELKQLCCYADRLRLKEGYSEDSAVVICRLDNNSLVSVCFHDHGAHKYVKEPGKNMTRIELHNGGETWVSRGFEEFMLFNDKGVKSYFYGPYEQLYSWGYKKINKLFVDCVKFNKPTAPNEEDGLRAVLLVETMIKSKSNGGQPMIVPSLDELMAGLV